jgi:NDP-sugar pyrophosphorylase family protein
MTNNAVRNIADMRVVKPTYKKDKYSIIILGANAGLRMRSYGPKPLLKVGGKTLFDIQYSILCEVFPNREVILVSGFNSHKVMSHTPQDVINVENESHEKTNVSRSIGLGLRAATTDHIIILSGDLYFNQETLFGTPFRSKQSCLLTNMTMNDREVGCVVTDDKICNLAYGLPTKWSQIGYFTGEELDLLRKFTWNRNNDLKLWFEAINYIIAHGGTLLNYQHSDSYVYDIDVWKDISTIENS